jgi:hypothetical protein
MAFEEKSKATLGVRRPHTRRRAPVSPPRSRNAVRLRPSEQGSRVQRSRVVNADELRENPEAEDRLVGLPFPRSDVLVIAGLSHACPFAPSRARDSPLPSARRGAARFPSPMPRRARTPPPGSCGRGARGAVRGPSPLPARRSSRSQFADEIEIALRLHGRRPSKLFNAAMRFPAGP